MTNQSEVRDILRDIDKIIKKYSKSDDKEVQKVIKYLRNQRKGFSARDAIDISFKLTMLADKVRQWIEQGFWT